MSEAEMAAGNEQRGACLDALLPHVDAYAQKIAKYYAAVGWEWVERRNGKVRYVPDATAVANVIRELIAQVRTNETGCCCTGGLEVGVTEDGAYITFSDSLQAEPCGIDEIDVYQR